MMISESNDFIPMIFHQNFHLFSTTYANYFFLNDFFKLLIKFSIVAGKEAYGSISHNIEEKSIPLKQTWFLMKVSSMWTQFFSDEIVVAMNFSL